MKVKVLGIENNKKWDIEESDLHFDGKYVYCEKLDEPRQNLEGNEIVTLKIDKSQHCFGVELHVGREYTVYFNDKKKVDFIAPYSK